MRAIYVIITLLVVQRFNISVLREVLVDLLGCYLY